MFTDYLRNKGQLNNTEISTLCEYGSKRQLRKKEFLLREGAVSDYISFIEKGLLRLYYIGDNGVEHILRFAIEDWWISDFESFHSGEPSKFFIEALEDCELLVFEKAEFEQLGVAVPAFKTFRDQLDSRNFAAHQRRILSNISDTAEEKYARFIRENPSIANRVPLHMIAAYLGLTRETLSRVRSAYSKK